MRWKALNRMTAARREHLPGLEETRPPRRRISPGTQNQRETAAHTRPPSSGGTGMRLKRLSWNENTATGTSQGAVADCAVHQA